LALSKAYTVIGGYQDDGDTATPPGSVLVVDNATPTKQWTVTASDPAPNDQFGSAVAISDTGTLLVGSQRDDDKGNDSGSVYVFELVNGAWVQQQKLTATDGTASARFGAALAISGTSALVSAPLSANGSGSTYWFANGWVNGSGCTDGADCATGLCIENVCCDAACDGLCRSCLGANTGGPSGTCAAIVAATDPYQECADTGAGSCGTNGLCDGAGACAKYAPGTPCTNSACVTPSIAPVESACDATGTCSPTSTLACAVGFQCQAGACSSTCTSNADCDVASGYSCTAFKLCQLPLGAACTSDGLCESGACQNAQCCTPIATGVCPAPLGGSCNIDAECAVGTCQAGVCSVMMGAGGGSGTGGSGAGGSPSAGAGASVGGSAGNGLAGSLASGGSSAASAGQAGMGEPPKGGIGLACVTDSDCPAELGCDPTSNTCQDRIVTSCACRAAGVRPDQPAWAWLVVASALLATRRRRFKASAGPSPVD
jgi:MYXO-CTERM domain-containing protein